MDIKIEIKEEPVWLEDATYSSFPATDVEETTIEEHTPDQLATCVKEENSVENHAVLTGGEVDSCDSSSEVLKTGSELMCSVSAGNVSNQSKGKPHRHFEIGIACSSKRYPRTHLLIDSRGQPKNCTKCGKMFFVKDIFKIHSSQHVKEWADCCDKCCKMLCMKSPHCCNECGKNFNYKSGLAQHMLMHSDGRRYCCEKCGKTFTSRSNLNKHQLIHSGERRHCCKKCGKRFVFKQVLIRHYLTHSGERVHWCKQCGKTFCLKGVLTQHLLTHSGERPHFCNKCGKTFRFKSNLTRHLLTHSVKCHTVV